MNISRKQYADLYGPTTDDRIRLGDTELLIEIERDLTTYGGEVKFGGGKVIRDGLGQSSTATHLDPNVPDLVITNAVILDHWGVIKADVGIKNGRITAIGKAGNPGIQDGVTPGLTIGASTEIIAGEGQILTAGSVDSHIPFYCPAAVLDSFRKRSHHHAGRRHWPHRRNFRHYLHPRRIAYSPDVGKSGRIAAQFRLAGQGQCQH